MLGASSLVSARFSLLTAPHYDPSIRTSPHDGSAGVVKTGCDVIHYQSSFFSICSSCFLPYMRGCPGTIEREDW